MTAPLFPDVGVVALVPDLWGVQWQPRHHVLTRLARYFNVVWVNPPHAWREIPSRLGARTDTNGSLPPGFVVYTPQVWLPRVYRPGWLARSLDGERLKRACALLSSKGCRKIVLYLWRPEFAGALSSRPFELACYHIDDEYSFSDVELPLDPVEQRVIQAVDHVFVHSPRLLERKGRLNQYTSFVPNGVNYEAYATPTAEPTDLAKVPRPRIGYTGFLKRQLDWSLMLDLSARRPEWSFVFVGPRSPHAELVGVFNELSQRPNVFFLGGKPAHELAAYAQHFDVCMLPYRRTHYTDCIYPMKLHEYLATGRPAIGTWIRSLEEFQDVVTLAETPAEWSRAIEEALGAAASSAERRAERQAIAQAHDWDRLVARIAAIIAERLGRQGAAQLSGSLAGPEN